MTVMIYEMSNGTERVFKVAENDADPLANNPGAVAQAERLLKAQGGYTIGYHAYRFEHRDENTHLDGDATIPTE